MSGRHHFHCCECGADIEASGYCARCIAEALVLITWSLEHDRPVPERWKERRKKTVPAPPDAPPRPPATPGQGTAALKALRAAREQGENWEEAWRRLV